MIEPLDPTPQAPATNSTLTPDPSTDSQTTPPLSPSSQRTSPSSQPDNQPSQPSQQAPGATGQAGPTTASPATQQRQEGASQTQQSTVSNTPPPVHPAVQRAGLMYTIAQTLAGGPQYKLSIDPSTGQATRTQIPVTRGQVGMAIALEAISGALAGAGQMGPGAIGRAGVAGMAAGDKIKQERQVQQDKQAQQAQEDAQSQSAAFARKASLAETNSRTVLNTAQAEAEGADSLDKLIAINRASGVLDVSPDILESTVPLTQAELLAGMQSGKFNATDHLGPIAGRQLITDINGNTRWEATHLVVKDPDSKVPLSQTDWDRYAAGGVKGFQAGVQIGANIAIPVRMLAAANEQLASHTLAQQRLVDLRSALADTPFAGHVPNSIDYTQPGVDTAMQAYQKYVSHDSESLSDPYTALQKMGAAKRDPKTGEESPNPDARYVDTIASTLGGFPLLMAAHDQIAANSKSAEQFAVVDSAEKATAVLANPKRFSPEQRSSATAFLRISANQGAAKASQEARAHAAATGADVEAMYRFGKNPVTGEKLTLDNAPDQMLVDPNGSVVPQSMATFYKPSAQQRTVADGARQVIAIADGLRQATANNPALIGPLLGRSKVGLSKLGLGDAEAQKMLDDVSLLQSATAKVHAGGRMSTDILKKVEAMISPSMNPAQFGGALDSIDGVMSRYANEDRLTTVSEFKAQGQQAQQGRNPQANQNSPNVQRIVPAGAMPGRNSQGQIVGYKSADGKVVVF